MSFCDWLISLCIMSSRFMYVEHMLHFLPLSTKLDSSVCINHILLIHSSISGYLGCFHFLAIVNSATLNTRVQICLGDPAFKFFIYMSSSRITMSFGSSIFNFWENVIPFYIPTNSAQGPHLLFTIVVWFGGWVVVTLMSVEWYFIEVFICISIMIMMLSIF